MDCIDESDTVESLADKLDSMLEVWTSPSLVLDFLSSHGSEKAVKIVQASLFSDRMFNLNFILRLNYGYASFLIKMLKNLDPYTRTQFIWQILQCTQARWSKAGFFQGDAFRLREMAKSFLSGHDMNCHPYTGSVTSWIQPFDECFFDAKSIEEASSGIPDLCFGQFERYVKSSLWLNRIFQSDFFAVSSPAKQVQMHYNLGEIPVLVMLKFVAQILHSCLEPNIKLAFWKKTNELKILGSTKTLQADEAIRYLCSKCYKCKPLFEAMFQFPQLYDKIYEAKFSCNSACFDWITEDENPAVKLSRRLIDEYSSFAEVALNLAVAGEDLAHDDVEYMLSKKKFNMVGEMVKDDLDLVSEVLSPMELLFLVLKYVRNDLCLECLESFEKWKPGFIEESRDCYGNNALWFLLHRRTVAHPNEDSASGKKKVMKKSRSSRDPVEKILIDQYKCNPDEENIYGLTWRKAFDILAQN